MGFAMAQFPPHVDWPKMTDDKFKAFADPYRAAMGTGADLLTTAAAYIHPQIVNTMRHYGLDGTNRFGFGSDAQKTANKVTNLMRRAAEHLVDSGQCIGHAYQVFSAEVWVPVQRAIAEQKNAGSQTLGV